MLRHNRRLESKEFFPFSTFILDTSLNDLFFSDTPAEWNIFEAQFDDAKPPSQAEITFFATRKLMNIIIEPEDFLPNGRLAHVYIPNYLYLPVTLTDALDIGDKNPNDTLSHDECFYIWSKARKARARATQTLPLLRPKTMAINVEGSLKAGVTSKDIILAVIAKIGTGGGQGYILEYRGSAIRELSMEAYSN